MRGWGCRSSSSEDSNEGGNCTGTSRTWTPSSMHGTKQYYSLPACVVDEFLASVIDMCEGYGVKAALETQLKVGTTVCHSTLQFSLSPKSNHVHFSLGLAVGLV